MICKSISCEFILKDGVEDNKKLYAIKTAVMPFIKNDN